MHNDFLTQYDALDAALVKAGFPATSPWWRNEIERFATSDRRRWVIRAGRRAGKSSTLCRIAVCQALFGSWSVPPGDIGVLVFVSTERSEAQARLRTIGAILRAIGVGFDERSEEIELHDRPLVFRVHSATLRGVVGFTSVGIFGDEVAKWENRDTTANPAKEVFASLRPTMASQPQAFEVLSSSPFGTDDYHHELYEEGDTEHQLTSFGATWECNPTISEATTHGYEPDARVWSREYAAQPGVTLSSALDPDDLKDAFARVPVGQPLRSFVAIDASSLREDAFAWIAGYESTAREIVIKECGSWNSTDLKGLSMTDIVNALTARCLRWNTYTIFGDQREDASLKAMFAAKSIRFISYDWTAESKENAFQLLRRLLRERKVCIMTDHPSLKSELVKLKARLGSNGRTTYALNGQDHASCIVTLMHASLDHKLLVGPRRSALDQFKRDNSFPLNRSRR
jgi:hypothetical protein